MPGEVKYPDAASRRCALCDGESIYEVYPAPDLELDVTIDFPHPVDRETAAAAIA